MVRSPWEHPHCGPDAGKWVPGLRQAQPDLSFVDDHRHGFAEVELL